MSTLTQTARQAGDMPDHIRDARIEDLAWMAETGETREEAARRLGLTVGTLEKFATRHCIDTWHRLRRTA